MPYCCFILSQIMASFFFIYLQMIFFIVIEIECSHLIVFISQIVQYSGSVEWSLVLGKIEKLSFSVIKHTP